MVHSYFDRPKVKGLTLKGVGAQQHFKDDCDLNRIIKKYPDGYLPPPSKQPVYGDFTALGSGLQESANALLWVNDWFLNLPAEIRAKFDNDPLSAQRFVLDNPKEAVDLGILQLDKPVTSPTETPKAAAKGGIGAENGAVAEPSTTAPSTTTGAA